ncbi:MAG TPA: MmcQ/YjbR family DNA-binding protein [Polyangiales bacterium]|nr:MmcQ/YjbR family DNA-binding protein [Polyangiales bacterium]
MVTAAQFRKLAMAFPEVEEKSHFEQPDFRVRNKIFAGLSRDHAEGNLKLTPELQAMVMSAEPDVFVPAAGAWGRSGWTLIVLAKAELPGLRELLAESYRLVAPKALLRSRPSLLDDAPEPKPKHKKSSPAKPSSKRKRSVRTPR